MKKKRTNPYKEANGAGVHVLPGVTTGDNAVIGAGSIVTKDIPADCVAVGNPCKVMKKVK